MMISPGANTPLDAIGSPDCSSLKVGCVPSLVVAVEVFGDVEVPPPALLFCGCSDNSRAAASCSSGTPVLQSNKKTSSIQVQIGGSEIKILIKNKTTFRCALPTSMKAFTHCYQDNG